MLKVWRSMAERDIIITSRRVCVSISREGPFGASFFVDKGGTLHI